MNAVPILRRKGRVTGHGIGCSAFCSGIMMRHFCSSSPTIPGFGEQNPNQPLPAAAQ